MTAPSVDAVASELSSPVPASILAKPMVGRQWSIFQSDQVPALFLGNAGLLVSERMTGVSKNNSKASMTNFVVN